MEKLRKEIEILLNKVSAENGSNTPDFILAEYLINCLTAFDTAVKHREKWYGLESNGVSSYFTSVQPTGFETLL